MIGIHLHALHLRRRRRNQIPILSSVNATPETRGVRIHYLGVLRVKGKEIYHAAQIEHPPRVPAVMRDIRTAHVAGDENGVDVMRADGGIEHGATAAWSNNAEPSGPIGKGAGQAQHDENCGKDTEFHWLLREVTAPASEW